MDRWHESTGEQVEAAKIPRGGIQRLGAEGAETSLGKKARVKDRMVDGGDSPLPFGRPPSWCRVCN